MARAKITYRFNPETGKREMHIDYQSDSDADRLEHEQEHRKLVRDLLGDLSGDEVQVERGSGAIEGPTPEPKAPRTVRETKTE